MKSGRKGSEELEGGTRGEGYVKGKWKGRRVGKKVARDERRQNRVIKVEGMQSRGVGQGGKAK